MPEKGLEIEALMRNVKAALEKSANLGKPISPEVIVIATNMEEPGRLADLTASNLDLKLEGAQEILEAIDPVERLRRAALGPLTPPLDPPASQHWATYDPVALPDPDAALELLLEPARWPDIAAVGGRFTALRSGALAGQTFEIEVSAEPSSRSPVFTRAYVTCTSLHTPGDAGLGDAVADLG